MASRLTTQRRFRKLAVFVVFSLSVAGCEIFSHTRYALSEATLHIADYDRSHVCKVLFTVATQFGLDKSETEKETMLCSFLNDEGGFPIVLASTEANGRLLVDIRAWNRRKEHKLLSALVLEELTKSYPEIREAPENI